LAGFLSDVFVNNYLTTPIFSMIAPLNRMKLADVVADLRRRATPCRLSAYAICEHVALGSRAAVLWASCPRMALQRLNGASGLVDQRRGLTVPDRINSIDYSADRR
jgi:hypothetical protein